MTTYPFGPVAPDGTTLTTGSTDSFGLGSLANQYLMYGYSTFNDGGPTADIGNGQYRSFTNYNSQLSGGTAQSLMQDFIAKSDGTQAQRADFIRQQQLLYEAGAYGTGRPTIGVFTAADQTAFAKVMGDYYKLASSGQAGSLHSLNDYIAMAAGIRIASGAMGGGSTRAPLKISYADPADLHAALQQGAQNALGRNLNASELDAFVSQFHSKEAAAQTAAYNGANYTPPSMTGEAQAFVDQNNSQEEGQRAQASYLDAMNSMLGVK